MHRARALQLLSRHFGYPARTEIAARALADGASKVDLLGFSDYADAIVDFIRSEQTEKPLTIAIDASWGMGKTTLMGFIQSRLKRPVSSGDGKGTPGRDGSYLTVWFNAWQYDSEESLWAAFVLDILGQMRRRSKFRQRVRLWCMLNWHRMDWKRVEERILTTAAIALGIALLGGAVFVLALLLFRQPLVLFGQYLRVAGWAGGAAAAYSVGKEVLGRVAAPFNLSVGDVVREPNYTERIGFFGQFQRDYKRVIDVITRKGRRPLVVFIDDLDRCSPPKPVEIVESINVLLDAEHCVFVIGMDAKSVIRSIGCKYKDLNDSENGSDGAVLSVGRCFLEKIVQIHFRIPRADQELITSFAYTHVGLPDEGGALEPAESEASAAASSIVAEMQSGKSLEGAAQAVRAEQPDLSPDAIERGKQEIRAQTFDESEEVRQAIREAIPYLGFNPRKIKRFINHFRLQALIANRRGLIDTRRVRLDLLGKWLVVASCRPDLIEALGEEPKLQDHLREAIRLHWELANPGITDPKFKKHVKEQITTLRSDEQMRQLLPNERLMSLLLGLVRPPGVIEEEDLFPYLFLSQITLGTDSPAASGAAPTDADVGSPGTGTA